VIGLHVFPVQLGEFLLSDYPLSQIT
jgi:hypothetical protein